MENSTLNLATSSPKITFSWHDYILFSIMLLLSVLIGLYFGCFGKKQKTADDYLMGGKEMRVIPIAISLVASHTSGITLLAIPADIYFYGANFWLGVISMFILCFITIYVYLPVFFNLQITSTYEYLEQRFDVKVRQFASFLFALSLVLYLPIVTYIPALAFSAATGFNVHLITPLVCGVCIFYTTIGGLKAVVWTDTLQFTVTVGAVFVVLILGTIASGGPKAIWTHAVKGHRLDIFDFDINPTKRDSFWTIVLGLTIHWVAHTSINQGCTQKFLAVPTLKQSKRAVVYYCIGMSIMKTLSVLTGLIMFKRYSNCDPMTTKQVQKNDQLLPYYVMDVAGSIPGLPGLFIAGVFCAALSTLSANLNCLAGTIYEDFFSKCLSKRTYQKSATYMLKIIVVVTGVISTALVYVVEHLGGLLGVSIALGSVAHGPLLGMFTLGVLFPKSNAKGALYGALIGVACMTSMMAGVNYYKFHDGYKIPPKNLGVSGCDEALNATLFLNHFNGTSQEPIIPVQPLFLFRISFYYNTLIGASITMFFGMVISYFTQEDDVQVDRKLLSPIIHFLLPEERVVNGQKEYYNVQKALDLVLVNSPDKNS